MESAIRHIKPPLAFCLFLALLTGCGKDEPRISPLGPGSVILAFGDSITWGTGAGENESYPAVLQELLHINVINAGIPGEVTEQGLARLPLLLDAHRPDLVVLCHGGNDILRRLDKQRIAANLRKMIRTTREHGSDVVLIGVPEFLFGLKTASFYREIAEEFNIPCEGKILSDILSTPSLKSDQIHPNAKGYKMFAQAIAEVIRKAQGK